MKIFKRKDYTQEFEDLKKEINRIDTTIQEESDRHNTKTETTLKEFKILKKEVSEIKETLKNIEKKLCSPTEIKVSDVTESVEEYEYPMISVPASNQKPYKALIYKDFEFYSRNRKENVLFNISDVLKLSILLEKDYDSNSERNREILPKLSRNGFLRLIYNYQQGYFKDYLKEYLEGTKFTIEYGCLLINGIKTNIPLSMVKEIILQVVNADDYYKCLDGLIKTYPKFNPLFIQVIADHYDNKKLIKWTNLTNKVPIENNPEKRKEKGYV